MKNFASLLILFTLSTVISCQKAVDLRPITENLLVEAQNARISIKTGFLTFKDWKDFYLTLQQQQRALRVDRERWEQERQFTSLNTLYEYVVDEELTNWENEEKLVRENPALIKTIKHKKSSLGLTYNKAVTIGDYGVEKNIFPTAYALLINTDGIVRIGDALIQITKTEAKSVKYEGEQSVTLLKSSVVTDPTKGVYINKIVTSNSTIASKQARPNAEQRDDKYNANGSLWLTSWARGSKTCFYDYSGSSGTGYYTIAQLTIEMRFLRKNIFGSWVDHRSETYSASGQWGQSSTDYTPPLAGHYGGTVFAPTINALFAYNAGTNWFGKTANPNYTLWYADLATCYFAEPAYAVGSAHNFQFVDIASTIAY